MYRRIRAIQRGINILSALRESYVQACVFPSADSSQWAVATFAPFSLDVVSITRALACTQEIVRLGVVGYSFPSHRKLWLYVPLSTEYSPSGEIVIKKLGPDVVLLDTFSFHVPLQTGDAWEQPKATTEITPANAQPRRLFFTSTSFRTRKSD